MITVKCGAEFGGEWLVETTAPRRERPVNQDHGWAGTRFVVGDDCSVAGGDFLAHRFLVGNLRWMASDLTAAFLAGSTLAEHLD